MKYIDYDFQGITRIFRGILFFFYIIAILALTFLGREPEPERMVWLTLFGSFQRAWNEQHTFIFWGIVVNFMMFLPLGILLPCGNSRWGFCRTVLAAFLLSVSIECAQYITRLGYFDVDDMITNVWGAAAGAGFCLSMKELSVAVRKDMAPRWTKILAGLLPFVVFVVFFGYFLVRTGGGQ